ncbi:protein POF1B-like [Oncorhynchus nerka]|uniref:protein POF1B-like n=1 Tax=Oncorhynchus nerka TaxID=8023 RepID=UPI0031B8A787
MFRDSSDGIEEYTTSVTGFITKCTKDVVPTVTSLQTITDYKGKHSRELSNDTSLPDELNNFYARFEASNTEACMRASAVPDDCIITLSVADMMQQIESIKILGVVKRARQRLFPLRRLKRFGMGPQILKRFYSCTIESFLATALPPTEVEEVKEELVNIVKENVVKRVIKSVSQVGIKSEVREVVPVVKMDTRFFGELLAEVYRKNCDIHTCISEHVAKIRGRKHLLDPSNDYKVKREDIEALIPKGASELTKQQLRYLLQTRMTADKTMRLLLTTFSSLREELIHMSEDLRRLESEKESLERDLSFKADQAEQYDRLLEAIRENNRQLQISLKETSSSQRTLETQLLSSRTTDSNRDFRIKELEGSYRALEKENEMLKQKLAGQCSNSTIQMNTEELSRQYSEQLAALRQEKDKELQSLRSQLTRITTEYTTERSGDKSLHLRITQLLTTLEQREVVIKRQEEDIRRLQQEKKRDSSKNVTTTTITKRYRNQYPLLGLLTDDYNSTSPVKDTKTIVIESRTGEMIKQEIITSP